MEPANHEPNIQENAEETKLLPNDLSRFSSTLPQPQVPTATAAPVQEKKGKPGKTVVKQIKEKKPATWKKAVRITLIALKWVVALILAIAILLGGGLGYLTVTEYNPAYSELAMLGNKSVNREYRGEPLSILTMNTGYAALGKTADFFMDGGNGVNTSTEEEVLDNMLAMERIVREVNPDVVFMQEVDTGSRRSFQHNQWQQYEYDLNGYESRYAANYVCKFVPYPIRKPSDMIGEVNSGIVTFSQYRTDSATRYSLFNANTWPMRVAYMHRCFLVSRMAIGETGKELVLINFHLEAYDDGEGRQVQLEEVLDFMQEEYDKGNYVVAGGDFNQCFPGTDKKYPLKPTSEWEPATLDDLKGDFRFAFDASAPTCRLLNVPYEESDPMTQYYVIDGFILSSNVELQSVKTLNYNFQNTDHNPVLLRIALIPEQTEE